jgi:hypothetical protein
LCLTSVVALSDDVVRAMLTAELLVSDVTVSIDTNLAYLVDMARVIVSRRRDVLEWNIRLLIVVPGCDTIQKRIAWLRNTELAEQLKHIFAVDSHRRQPNITERRLIQHDVEANCVV